MDMIINLLDDIKNVENVENVENIENVEEITRHKEYSEYRKNWCANNKEKLNNYAKLHYLKKLNDLGEEYRDKINKKNKETRLRKREKLLIENPGLLIKTGRPKKISKEIVQKKANGRPRKFNLDGTII